MGLRTLCAVSFAVNIEDTNGTLITHTLLGDADDLFVVFAKRHALYGGREFPEEKTFARLDGPQAHGIIC